MIKLSDLTEVDVYVRREFFYARDSETDIVRKKWGFVKDIWKLPEEMELEGFGDCDDFCIYASMRLIEEYEADRASMYWIISDVNLDGKLDHICLACTTSHGLYSCADTWEKTRQPAYIPTAYKPEMLLRYARLDKPTEWIEWNLPQP